MLDELIDVLSAPQRLLWQALPGLHDAETGEAYRGSQVAGDALGLDPEGVWAKALGFGAEAALDPLNLLGGLAVKGVRRAAKGATEANLARDTLLAKGAMPEEAAALTKVRNELGPVRTYHGTPHVYDRPDPAKFDPDGLFGPGYYTTQGPELASEYAHEMAGPMRLKRSDLEWMIQKYSEAPPGAPPHRLEYNRLAAERYRGELAKLPVPRENVRMQHLDIRNPLDLGRTYPEDEARSLFERVVGRPLEEDAGFGHADGERLFSHMSSSDGLGGGAEVIARLKDLGYDGITHLPGTGSAAAGVGGEAERVWIAMHPDQVYAPWLAPAARDVPSATPWLAALGGYNGGMAYAR